VVESECEMSLLYIFAASGMEGQPVRRIGVPSGSNSALRCGSNDLVLITSGMGPVNARKNAETALMSSVRPPAGPKPDVVLIIGLCGGLIPSLPERRIVAYTECRATDAKRPSLRCSGPIVDSLIDLLKDSSISCDRVVGITASQIATTPNQRRTLAQHGAAVVDMETYVILETAAAAGISAAALRVISDSFYRELPDFNRALRDDGTLDGWKALQVALGSPIRTARMLAANNEPCRSFQKPLTSF
jgi:nucleoside phosphorylase